MESVKTVEVETSLDMNKIAESLKRSTEMLEPLSDDCCIYIVPPHLRDLNTKAFTPKLVSIGPFHHGKPELRAMEEHKRRYLCDFLRRINMTLEEYIKHLQELEVSNLLNSYAETTQHGRQKFMEIMAIDGAFLVEYFLKYSYEDWQTNDRIFGRQNLRLNVRFDILLIENQLPFFYLNYLFELFKKSVVDNGLSLTNIVGNYLVRAIMAEPLVTNFDVVGTEHRQIHHLVDFLRICLQPLEIGDRIRQCNNFIAPTISELHRAGVKFKPSSRKHLSEIKFKNGILEIPKFILVDNIEELYLNMEAFEQCHKSETRYINDYIAIMDMLINNEEDVELLVRNGIIENWLEDNHVAATIFNKLGKGNIVEINDFYYSDVIEDLNAYCKTPWHSWKAMLKQKYFNNPWTIISVVAAAFLLLLTIIQTVCSILQLR